MAEAIFTARREDDSVAVSFDYETISNTYRVSLRANLGK